MMVPHFAAYFLVMSALVMLFGTRQRRPNDRYALAAWTHIALLAGASAFLLRGTVMFAPAAFAIAALQGVHHMIVHYNEEDRCSPFQFEAASGHVTGIAVAVTAGVVSGLRL